MTILLILKIFVYLTLVAVIVRGLWVEAYRRRHPFIETPAEKKNHIAVEREIRKRMMDRVYSFQEWLMENKGRI